MNLEKLNAEELVSIDGGRRLPSIPPGVKRKFKEALECVKEFASGFWDEITNW